MSSQDSRSRLKAINQYLYEYVHPYIRGPPARRELAEGLYRIFLDPVTSDEDYLALPTAEFYLSVRARDAIQNNKLETVKDLAGCDPREMFNQLGFGEVTYREIVHILQRRGLGYRADR